MLYTEAIVSSHSPILVDTTVTLPSPVTVGLTVLSSRYMVLERKSIPIVAYKGKRDWIVVSLTVLSSKYTVLEKKSIPIVGYVDARALNTQYNTRAETLLCAHPTHYMQVTHLVGVIKAVVHESCNERGFTNCNKSMF